jgi:hypothetical protein
MSVVPDSPISLIEIENIVKQFKTHRCALDFDKGFINGEGDSSAGVN